MANQTLPIATILQAAKLAQGYAAVDRARKNFLYGGIVNELMPEKIYLIRKSVQYQFSINPSNETLRGTANYLWTLCGVYGLRALNALGMGGGSVIVTTSGGSVTSVTWDKVQFVIGDSSQSIPDTLAAPNGGDTVVVLPYRIVPKSEVVFYQGAPVKLYPSNDFNFIATYGTTDTTYTFSSALTDGFGLEFDFVKIVSSTTNTNLFGNSLQSIPVIAPSDGNTLIVGVLGLFVLAIKQAIPYDTNYITQTGTSLDFTNVGGVVAGEVITIFYYPSVS